MDQNNNQNANWNFDINLSGVRAATGAAANVPEGYYKATLTDAYTLNDKPGRVIFKLTISEGEYTGTVRTTGLGVPKSAEDNVRYYWRALLESSGYTPAQIDAGQVGMNRNLLVGRTVTVHYVPGDKEAGIYETLNFLPPTEFATRSAAFERNKGSNTVVTGGAQQSVGSALGAALGGGALGGGMPSPAVNVAAPANGLGGVGVNDLMAALGKR